MKRIVVFILSVLTAGALATALRAADEGPLYKIKLDRGDPSPGDRYQFARDERIHLTIQPRPATQSAIAPSPHYLNTMYAISGACEDLTVESHRTCKLRFTVQTALFNGRSILPPGTVLIAEDQADRVHYLINGQPPNSLPLRIAKLLPLTHHLNDEHRLDALLKTATPRHIGAVWSGDPHAYVQNLANLGTILQEKDVAVTGQLLGLEQVNRQQLMQVQIDVDARHVSWPTASAQVTGSMRSQVTITLPLDNRYTYPRQMFSHSVRKEHVSGQGGKTPIDEDRTYDIVAHVQVSALPAAQPTTASSQP